MTLIERQQKAASLVKQWSNASFDDGRSLSDYLNVEGWPLWPMIDVELAVYHVGHSLTGKTDMNLTLLRLKHELKKLRTVFMPCPSVSRILGEDGWPSRPVALFLGFSAYMLRDVLLPVVNELSDDSQMAPVVLYDANISKRSYNGKIFNSQLSGKRNYLQLPWQVFLTEHARSTSRSIERLLAQRTKILLGSERLPLIIRDARSNLWGYLCRIFEWLLKVRLPSLLPVVASAEHLFDNYPVALLISPDVADPRIRAYIQLAKPRGIKTLEIQFGTYGPESIEWQFFLADLLSVWGSRPKEIMEAHGVHPEKIEITGSPRHDSLAQQKPETIAGTLARLGIKPEDTLILFASTHSSDTLCNPGVIRAMKEAVFKACKTFPNVRLAVKPHPLENVVETRAVIAESSDFIFLEPAEDIRSFIIACDIFISTGSSSTLDALIAEKPVICLNFPGWETFSDLFACSGATLPARSAEETRQAIFELLPSGSKAIQEKLKEGRERFVEEWAYKMDGRSAARVADLARNLVRNSKT